MALDQSALLELLEVMRGADGGELMRRLLATILQLLVDAEATAFVGAEPHERSLARTNRRNGTRDKLVATATGDITVKIPKVRAGSFFPSLLAPRRRVDVALHAVVMQAWVEGVSTRKVDDLVAALGVESGICKSEVSRICAQLDSDVTAWRGRDLSEQPTPYVFLDATYCKARVNGRVVSRAVVIATGVTADGHREVLGVDALDGDWCGRTRGRRRCGQPDCQDQSGEDSDNLAQHDRPSLAPSEHRLPLRNAVRGCSRGQMRARDWHKHVKFPPHETRGRRS